MNDPEALALLFELLRRATPKERPALVRQVWPFIQAFHDAQRRFHEDKSKFKAAVCSGRAGKSVLAGSMLVEAAGDIPESNAVYVGPTRLMAKRIIWRELIRLNEKWSLGMVPNQTDLTMTLRNGSVIHVVGANNADQIDKIRGIPITLAVIDEAGMIGAYLKELVEEVIEPRLMDFDGSIMLIGTPTAACAGYFYDVTRDDDPKKRLPGWSVHHWTVFENPFVPRYPTKELPDARTWVMRHLARKGWTLDHPSAQREYLGRWVRSVEDLVFHAFHRGKTLIPRLPQRADWQYGLGVDLGHDDGTGIVEQAFTPEHHTVYTTRTWRHPKMTTSGLVRAIRDIEKERKGLAFVVIDQAGAGKMIAEDLREIHGLPCEGAEKVRKPTFIRLLNSDLALGKLRILGHENAKGDLVGPCDTLLREVPGLQWDPAKKAKGIFIEDGRMANDISDGWIYSYRKCRHYLYEGEEEDFEGDPEQVQPEPGTEAALNKDARKHHREVARRRQEAANKEWWES